METKTEVKIIQVDFDCPKCVIGNLIPDEYVLNTYSSKYPHSCNRCDYKQVFNVTYPYYIYEKI